MPHHKSTLQWLVEVTGDPQQVWLALKKKGVSHLLINLDIFKRWVHNTFTAGDRDVVEGFFIGYARLQYFKSGFGVYRLENS
jgi:hypothetical protein